MPRVRRPLLVISLALLVTQASADAVVGKASSSAVRERVLDLVNHARASSRRCGDDRFSATTPLTPSSVLNRAARDHARDMARNNYFEHIGRDGSTPKERLARLNYRSSLTGENIAFGPESAEEVVSGWLASPGHCANIMEPHYLEMGIAVASGKKRGAIYWVQDFAAPHR